ncbi:MAG: hypothetical protein NTW50_05240 [Candidatus Berkelbacteria bacterium]|nr:hypothetical protein [Candidatus Berkelbacteria bacterium]
MNCREISENIKNLCKSISDFDRLVSGGQYKDGFDEIAKITENIEHIYRQIFWLGLKEQESGSIHPQDTEADDPSLYAVTPDRNFLIYALNREKLAIRFVGEGGGEPETRLIDMPQSSPIITNAYQLVRTFKNDMVREMVCLDDETLMIIQTDDYGSDKRISVIGIKDGEILGTPRLPFEENHSVRPIPGNKALVIALNMERELVADLLESLDRSADSFSGGPISEKGVSAKKLNMMPDGTRQFEVTRDGKYVVSTSYTHSLCLWNIEGRCFEKTIANDVTAFATSQAEPNLIFYARGGRISEFNIDSSEKVMIASGLETDRLSVDPTGQFLFAIDYDSNFRIIRVEDGKAVFKTPLNLRITPKEVFLTPDRSVWFISPDGRYVRLNNGKGKLAGE